MDGPSLLWMDLFIETLSGTVLELRVSPYESVLAVKAKIQRVEGIPITQQHLIFNNHELNDDLCLQDYLIPSGSKVRLVLGMRGGPINTRRVIIPQEPDQSELLNLLSKQDCGNKQVTLLVLRDGDQVNFFRVMGRGDGTLSPITAGDSARSRTGCHNFGHSASSTNSVSSPNSGEDDDALAGLEEDQVLKDKLRTLQTKMDQLRINRRNHVPASSEPASMFTPKPPPPRTIQTEPLQTCFRRLPPIRMLSSEQQHQPKPPGLSRVPSQHLKLSEATNNVSSQSPTITKSRPSFERQTTLTRLKTPARLLSNSDTLQSKLSLASGGVVLPPVPSAEPLGGSGSKPRCFMCQRKTGLATSYQCRCGRNFCTKHRYPETHACDFDFKSEGRRLLQEANPLVTAAKLPKI